jgi:nitroreductase
MPVHVSEVIEMTTASVSTRHPARHEVLRNAAMRALLAPSVHNTQPWRFVLTDDTLEVHADFGRQLHVLDPRARQLTISGGCALLNARVAIEALGFDATIDRFPRPGDRAILAHISLGSQNPHPHSVDLNRAIERRRTNRRQFTDEPVPDLLIASLVDLAAQEGVALVPILQPEHRAAVSTLSMMADRIEQEDPAYVAEIAAWTTNDPRRRDGIQAATIPYGQAVEHNEVLPLRNFDVHGIGWLPSALSTAPEQCLLLLCSAADTPADWLHTGEALERIWLELTHEGYWASPLTQVIEVGLTRGQLQRAIGRPQHPQLLLRVGRAPNAEATPRRRSEDVLVDHSSS